MAINKVIYDGETLMDVTDSTVSEENLLAGAVAYNAAGERITGALVTAPVDSIPTEGSGNAVSSGGVFAAIGAAANVTASKVKFADGETFQQKYDRGELTGPAGADGKNAEANRQTATLTTGGWSSGSGGYAYQQTITTSGVTANTDFDVDVNLSGTDAEADALILEAFGLVTFADSVSGGIKFACATDKPGVNIPINIRIYG